MPTLKSQGFRMKETYTYITVLVTTGAQHVCLLWDYTNPLVGMHF